MRVLLIDRALANGYSLGLAHGLKLNGVDVCIGGPTRSGEIDVQSVYPRAAPGQAFGKAVDGVLGAMRFLTLLKRRPDIVHVQWPTVSSAFYMFLAKYGFDLPIAYTVHNFHRKTDPARYELIQNRLIELADLVLTHGPTQLESLVAAHPQAATKAHVVEHGNYEHIIHQYPREQARRSLKLSNEVPLYVFVGQIRPRKGVDLLLEAFAQHRSQGHSGDLLIVGTSTDPAYERLLLNLADRSAGAVHWRLSKGALPQQTLDLAISAATQVVLPFHDAAQSGTLVLAMTHGRCVVSTATGEVARTLGSRGIVVPPGDSQQLVNALALAESDTKRCDDFGRRAREYALSHLDWSVIAAQTAQLYDRTLATITRRLP